MARRACAPLVCPTSGEGRRVVHRALADDLGHPLEVLLYQDAIAVAMAQELRLEEQDLVLELVGLVGEAHPLLADVPLVFGELARGRLGLGPTLGCGGSVLFALRGLCWRSGGGITALAGDICARRL